MHFSDTCTKCKVNFKWGDRIVWILADAYCQKCGMDVLTAEEENHDKTAEVRSAQNR